MLIFFNLPKNVFFILLHSSIIVYVRELSIMVANVSKTPELLLYNG